MKQTRCLVHARWILPAGTSVGFIFLSMANHGQQEVITVGPTQMLALPSPGVGVNKA